MNKSKHTLYSAFFSGLTLLLSINLASAQVCMRNVTPQTMTPANFDFSISGEAKDMLSELIWARCVVGQTWDGTNCVGAPKKLTWQEALLEAQTFNGSGDGWRLPDIKELNTIIDRQCASPPINLIIFPDNPASQDNGLWSSTPYIVEEDAETNAWFMSLGFGQMNYRAVSTSNFVRFVKGFPKQPES